LSHLAKSEGFTEKEEARGFRSKRFDRVWRRDNDIVALEHENKGVKVALEDEVRKLAGKIAQLHVCITYLPSNEFPGTDYVERCIEVLEDERFRGDFLLVLGTKELSDPRDWVCHHIFTAHPLRSETLVFPTLKPTRTVRGGGRTGSGRSRQESGWMRLKRSYPSSRAVTAVLREARKRRFTPRYIRVLEALRDYWLRQSK
jgi:hypothetical protein